MPKNETPKVDPPKAPAGKKLPGVRGAGRPAGAVNKIKKEIAEDARQYAPEALKTLAEIMQDKRAPAASRVSAANYLLDRGYGKAPQALTLSGDEDAPPLVQTIQLVPVFGADPDMDALLDPAPAKPDAE